MKKETFVSAIAHNRIKTIQNHLLHPTVKNTIAQNRITTIQNHLLFIPNTAEKVSHNSLLFRQIPHNKPAIAKPTSDLKIIIERTLQSKQDLDSRLNQGWILTDDIKISYDRFCSNSRQLTSILATINNGPAWQKVISTLNQDLANTAITVSNSDFHTNFPLIKSECINIMQRIDSIITAVQKVMHNPQLLPEYLAILENHFANTKTLLLEGPLFSANKPKSKL